MGYWYSRSSQYSLPPPASSNKNKKHIVVGIIRIIKGLQISQASKWPCYCKRNWWLVYIVLTDFNKSLLVFPGPAWRDRSYTYIHSACNIHTPFLRLMAQFFCIMRNWEIILLCQQIWQYVVPLIKSNIHPWTREWNVYNYCLLKPKGFRKQLA